jgi:DNA gyrase subunit A
MLSKFKHLRRKGIIAISLDEGDDLIDARLTDGNQEVLLSSESGMACRFRESDCRSMGRNTRGVRGMELRDKDGNIASRIVSMTIVDPEADLLVITANGMGKRTRIGTGIAEQDKDIIGGYRLTRRGSKGVISIRLKDKDRVVCALQVISGDEILMTSVKGQLVRISTDEIRAIGRNSQGVKVMRLREKDLISSVSKVSELDDEEVEGEVEGEGVSVTAEGATTAVTAETITGEGDTGAEAEAAPEADAEETDSQVDEASDSSKE